jgi:hypothetical protein
MASNGQRRPQRPRIEVAAASATPEESAAIAAAIERFLIEMAPAPQPVETRSPWQQAGLIEGVGAKRRAFPVDPGSGLPVT